MPTLTPEQHALRTRCCGLPARVTLPPKGLPVIPDPDDPAVRELTTAEAAAAAHVSEDVIRQWASRKGLQPVNPGEPSPRYLELDVLRIEAATRRAPRARQLLDEAAQIVQPLD